MCGVCAVCFWAQQIHSLAAMALKVLKPLKNGGWARRKVSAKKKGKAKRFDTPAVSNLHPVIALTFLSFNMFQSTFSILPIQV